MVTNLRKAAYAMLCYDKYVGLTLGGRMHGSAHKALIPEDIAAIDMEGDTSYCLGVIGIAFLML